MMNDYPDGLWTFHAILINYNTFAATVFVQYTNMATEQIHRVFETGSLKGTAELIKGTTTLFIGAGDRKHCNCQSAYVRIYLDHLFATEKEFINLALRSRDRTVL